MRFEWDPRKAAANIAKHGVSFAEAQTVFDDPLYLTFEDEALQELEPRFLTIGHSDRQRLLIVWHTETAELIRLIGARKATKNERKTYEEGR